VSLEIDGDIIKNAKFRTLGCGAAIATSSMATELVRGKTVQEAISITNKNVAEALGGLPPSKMHCSALAEQALQAALADYSAKSGVVVEGLREIEHEGDDEHC
jgi:nitrogen fixation NifU-like protein